MRTRLAAHRATSEGGAKCEGSTRWFWHEARGALTQPLTFRMK